MRHTGSYESSRWSVHLSAPFFDDRRVGSRRVYPRDELAWGWGAVDCGHEPFPATARGAPSSPLSRTPRDRRNPVLGTPQLPRREEDVLRIRDSAGPALDRIPPVPADVERHLRRRKFFETPYGRGLWVSIWADGDVNWREVEKLVEAGYRQVANKRMRAAMERRTAAGD